MISIQALRSLSSWAPVGSVQRGDDIETFVGMDRAGAKAFIGGSPGSCKPSAGRGRHRRRGQRILPGRSIRTGPCCDLRVVTTTAASGCRNQGRRAVRHRRGPAARFRRSEQGTRGSLPGIPPDSTSSRRTASPTSSSSPACSPKPPTPARAHRDAYPHGHAAQRRLFSLWLNHPLDAAAEHSTDEFAGTFGAQDTRDQIAISYRRITGRSTCGAMAGSVIFRSAPAGRRWARALAESPCRIQRFFRRQTPGLADPGRGRAGAAGADGRA